VQDPKTPEEQEKHERYNRSLEQILRDILEAKGKSKSGKKYIFIKVRGFEGARLHDVQSAH
jgi:hypothetical protein